MDVTLWFELTGLVILLGLSAFFSSSETSHFSLDRSQLAQMRRDKNPRVDLIEQLLSQPRRLIVTILIGNEFVNVAASVISAGIVIRLLGAELNWVNVFVMVPTLLLFGEIAPKTLAIGHNVRFATFQCTLIDRFAQLIGPVRWLVRHISDFIITFIVGEERTAGSIATEDMVRLLTKEAVGEGALDASEARYIHQIFDFGDTIVRDIATPRSQIFMLPVSMPLNEVVVELDRTRHTKVPVHADGDKDTILGILFARDLLGIEWRSEEPAQHEEILRKLLRKTHFIPDTVPASDLFLSFRRRKLSIALTVDEYGGVTGLVTMEDLLECIFGEIESRSEQRRRQRIKFEDLGSGQFRIDASMTMRQFNEVFNCSLSDDTSETVGGVLLSRYGQLPHEGTAIKIDGIEFTVVSIVGHRIGAVIVDMSARQDKSEEQDANHAEPDEGATDAGDETTKSSAEEPAGSAGR